MSSSERSGRRWTNEGWQDARTDWSRWSDAAIAAATLVEAPSDTDDDAVALYSVPFGLLRLTPETEGEDGRARRWDFWGVVGREGVLAV